MIAASRLPTPAPAAAGSPGIGAGTDPAAGAFAVLLAGLVPLPTPVVVAPLQRSAAAGPAGSPGLAAMPAMAAAPTAPTIPAAPAAAPPASSVAAGRPVPQPTAELSNGSGDKLRPAAVPPAGGAGSASPLPVPPQVTGSDAEPRFQGRTTATPLLDRPPSTGNSAAGPAPVPFERALARLADGPPVVSRAPAAATAGAPRPPAGAMGPVPATERAPAPPSNAPDAPLPPSARATAATPPVALAGSEPSERAPVGDAVSEPAIEIGEIAPTRAERTASEPLGSSQRAAPPPPLVQVGVQIAIAATRRVERMVVQLEPAALGRVEVRLDFSHDNRVSALIAADRPETLEVLQRDSRALERSLQDAGLRLAENALSFSLRQEHRQRQDAAGESSGPPPGPPVGPLAQVDVRAAQWFLAERVLDIRI